MSMAGLARAEARWRVHQVEREGKASGADDVFYYISFLMSFFSAKRFSFSIRFRSDRCKPGMIVQFCGVNCGLFLAISR